MSDFLSKNFNKVVKGYGRLVMVHSRAGERLYFFRDRHKNISMIPAELVDEEYRVRQSRVANHSADSTQTS